MADRAQTVPSPTGSERQDSLPAQRVAGAIGGSKRVAVVAVLKGLAAAGVVAGGCSRDKGENVSEDGGTWRITADPDLTKMCPLD